MQIGTRFRCYPTPAQRKTLSQWIGCQRTIYNAKVAEDRYFRAFARKSLEHTGQYAPIDQQYSQFKSDLTPWLSQVPCQVLRNGAYKWKQAYQRFFDKLGGRPTIQTRHGKQSVWITKELFTFEKIKEEDGAEDSGSAKEEKEEEEDAKYLLYIGTKKHPVGTLRFAAHRKFKLPGSIHVSVYAGHWYLSFSYDNDVVEPSDKETGEWLRSFTEAELASMTLGLDRGVNIPLAASDGQQFDFRAIEKKRIAKHEKYKRRWQRRQARRVKGSARWKKAGQRAASYQRYVADVRRDFCHQTSHKIASDDRYKLFVFEALAVKNMTASAKGTLEKPGKNVHQKAGLNRAILASGWGQVKVYTQYKARRAGKLAIEVPPHHSSQECSQCGFTHQDNRLSQAVFVCLNCKHTENADINAGKVLAKRGVSLILSDGVPKKKVRQVRVKKHKVGVECSEPAGEIRLTLEETPVIRPGGNTRAFVSVNRETPATPPAG